MSTLGPGPLSRTPGLAALIAEAFPNNEWRYVRPDRRQDPGHLQGFDRKSAPRFAWGPDEPRENAERKPQAAGGPLRYQVSFS